MQFWLNWTLPRSPSLNQMTRQAGWMNADGIDQWNFSIHNPCITEVYPYQKYRQNSPIDYTSKPPASQSLCRGRLPVRRQHRWGSQSPPWSEWVAKLFLCLHYFAVRPQVKVVEVWLYFTSCLSYRHKITLVYIDYYASICPKRWHCWNAKRIPQTIIMIWYCFHLFGNLFPHHLIPTFDPGVP